MEITVSPGGVELAADLDMPTSARGLVIFAHGSGSSRRSPRNRQVAGVLQEAGLGTLLFDLLTESEERRDAVDASLRFDIEFLANRLTAVVDEAREASATSGMSIGLFGASTGAAAALSTAAARPDSVIAVVSRGGRPDLAGDALAGVRAPTLLLVGGKDEQVVGLNESAAAQLTGMNDLHVVPGATHLFEEPGALEEVARQAVAWFVRFMP